MKYYSIHFTLDSKIRGSNDYIKNHNIKIPNEKLFWEEPKFIGNIYNEKIDFNPYLLDIELFAKSKINDLIMDDGPVSTKLIISEKLKIIFEKFRKTGMQFFNINIIQKDEVFNNYWILNMYEKNFEVIDFQKSKFYETKNTFELIKDLKIDSALELNKIKKNIEIKGYPYGFFIDKIKLNDNVFIDFFMLTHVEGGIKYIASEKLKQEIEKQDCTGIEFRPIELSLNEWSMPAGEREKIYGKS